MHLAKGPDFLTGFSWFSVSLGFNTILKMGHYQFVLSPDFQIPSHFQHYIISGIDTALGRNTLFMNTIGRGMSY
jgi:hypothetical protein